LAREDKPLNEFGDSSHLLGSVGGHAWAPLTYREVEVGALVACGLTNRGIGRALGIAEGTVARHVKHSLHKLAFHSRAELAAWIVEHRPGVPSAH
jgi:DNA-binding NarL/FixJ family response regulator